MSVRAMPCTTCGRDVSSVIAKWDGLAAGRLASRVDGRVRIEYHTEHPWAGDRIDNECNFTEFGSGHS